MAECVYCNANFPTNLVEHNWGIILPLPTYGPSESINLITISILKDAGRPRFYRNRTYGICESCANILSAEPFQSTIARSFTVAAQNRRITGLQSLTTAVNAAFHIRRDPRLARPSTQPQATAMQIHNPVPAAPLPTLQPARMQDRTTQDLLLQPSAVIPPTADPLSEPEICDICALDKPVSEFVTTQCGHRFCRDCIVKWVNEYYGAQRKRTCPICRANIVRAGR